MTIRLDNFMLAMHQTCPRKFFYRILNHWVPPRKSAALGFGAVIHEGLATWYRTHDSSAAIDAIHSAWPENHPSEDYRSLTKALHVMAEYIRAYPEENFSILGFPSSPMVEIPFCLPLTYADGTQVYTDQGTDIEYGGIFDGLIEFSGEVYALEHKSTSQLGDYYFDQFKPNNQVTGYVWGGAKLSGHRVTGALINAIGIYKASATKFRRQVTTRSESEIAEWVENVRSVASEIEWHLTRDHYPMRTVSCTMYGRCEFHDVCTLGTAAERTKRLTTDYIQEPWDFETRTGNAV